MKIISGIYSIINTINGKTYYGSSNNVYHRWAQHKHQLRKNIHTNNHLQNSWNQYGEKTFKFNIIEEVSQDQLLDVEQKYLDITKQTPEKFYNIINNAERPQLGMIHTDETRQKMSIKLKEAWATGKFDNRNHSHCKGHLGHKHSEETKKKCGNSRRGKPGTMLGKHLTKEQCRKVSLSLIGTQRRLDKTIYTFKNKYTDEVFTGTSFDLKKKYNINHLRSVVNGYRKSAGGWTLI